MSWQRIRTVFSKELTDNLRDRRSLSIVALVPLLGPAFTVLMLLMLGRVSGEVTEHDLDLPIVGAEHAPELVAFLDRNYMTIHDLGEDADARARVKSGAERVVLVIPPDFGEALRHTRPARLELVYNGSDQLSSATAARVRRQLHNYAQRIESMRLLARGVSPIVTNSIAIAEVDLSSPQARAALLLLIIPYMVILAAISGGFYIAIDTTAGERERGSLEPLLINPASRLELVLGKLGATWLFGMICVVIASFGFLAVRLFATDALMRRLNIEFTFDLRLCLQLLAAAAPFTLFAACMQMVVASFCRSFKEAQVYVSFLMLVPIIPALMLWVAPFDPKVWMMMVPSLGEQLLMLAAIKGEPLAAGWRLISLASTGAASALLLAAATWLYSRERILTLPAD